MKSSRLATLTWSPLRKIQLDFVNNFTDYLNAIAAIFVCTLVSKFLHFYLHASNMRMIYILGVAVVALKGKPGPAGLASILSVCSYDFFFIYPHFSFSISELQEFVTLFIMLVVGQTISHLAIGVRQQIEETQHAIKETEKERFRNLMLSSISHDLRTPLTAIMGSASSMLHAGAALTREQQDELIQNIYDESERLNLLVNNILKIIRLEAGSVKIIKQPYDMKQLLQGVLDKLKKRHSDTRFEVLLPHGEMPFVMLDNMLIEQVFINLIENAIKYSPADAPVEISLSYTADEVSVVIADHGKGIDSGEIEKIFEKFYRGPQADADSSGFGLGLAICKGIVLAHQGRIEAEPRQDGGTLFCFTLPLS